MPEFENSAENIEAKKAKNLEEGLIRLEELAESKFSEKGQMVMIVINGLPNSGKTELRRLFQNKFGVEGGKTEAAGIVGFNDIEKLSGLPSKFLIVEVVSYPLAVQAQAKRLGLTVDIYAYILNPALTEDGPSAEDSLRADIIIENPDSKIK